jgi:hypothetical protein
MESGSTDDGDSYLRAAIVTSEHPGKPLDGIVVAISTPHDVSIDEPYLGAVVEEAEERFNIDQYATELRIGTAYFNDVNGTIVGVTWENSPLVYEHGDFDEPVAELPEGLHPAEQLLE